MIMRLAAIAGALALMMTAPVLAQQGAAPTQPGSRTSAGAGQAVQAVPGSAPMQGADQQAGAGERGERGGRGRLAACRADVQALCKGVEAGGGRKMACLSENMAKLSPDCAAIVQARADGNSERGGRGRMGGRSALGAGAAGAGAEVAQAQGQGAPAPGVAGAPPAVNAAPGSTVNGAAPQAGAPQGGVSGGGAPASASAPFAKGEGKGGRQRMAACRTDVATFCQNAEKGGGRMRCLKENQAKLSPECQAVLTERVQAASNFRQACKADQAAHCAGVERGGGKLMQCLRENQAKLSPACGEAITAMPERGGKARGKRAEAAPRLQ